MFNQKYATRGYTFALAPVFPLGNNNYQAFGDLREMGISINIKL